MQRLWLVLDNCLLAHSILSLVTQSSWRLSAGKSLFMSIHSSRHISSSPISFPCLCKSSIRLSTTLVALPRILYGLFEHLREESRCIYGHTLSPSNGTNRNVPAWLRKFPPAFLSNVCTVEILPRTLPILPRTACSYRCLGSWRTSIACRRGIRRGEGPHHSPASQGRDRVWQHGNSGQTSVFPKKKSVHVRLSASDDKGYSIMSRQIESWSWFVGSK